MKTRESSSIREPTALWTHAYSFGTFGGGAGHCPAYCHWCSPGFFFLIRGQSCWGVFLPLRAKRHRRSTRFLCVVSVFFSAMFSVFAYTWSSQRVKTQDAEQVWQTSTATNDHKQPRNTCSIPFPQVACTVGFSQCGIAQRTMGTVHSNTGAYSCIRVIGHQHLVMRVLCCCKYKTPRFAAVSLIIYVEVVSALVAALHLPLAARTRLPYHRLTPRHPPCLSTKTPRSSARGLPAKTAPFTLSRYV